MCDVNGVVLCGDSRLVRVILVELFGYVEADGVSLSVVDPGEVPPDRAVRDALGCQGGGARDDLVL